MAQSRKRSKTGAPNGEFGLRPWYGREDAKRALGAICRAVYGGGTAVGVAGTEERPGLILEAAGACAASEEKRLVPIGVDEATKDWSGVYGAATFYGVQFLIHERKTPRAVLRRARRPRAYAFLEQYRRNIGAAKAKDYEGAIDEIEEGMDALDRRVKAFGRRLTSLTEAVERVSEEMALLDGRLRAMWRASEGLPPLPAATTSPLG